MKKLTLIVAIVLSAQFGFSQENASIIVHSQCHTIFLTAKSVAYLMSLHIQSVTWTLKNFKSGGTIRNTEVADIIISLLKNKP